MKKINRTKVQVCFHDRKDGFIGFFPSVGKVVNFCNRKYNKRTFPFSTGHNSFNILSCNEPELIGNVISLSLLKRKG